MKNATVDFSKEIGVIKPMHSVNNGPFVSVRDVDTRKGFLEAGIPFIRNHDASFCSLYGGEHSVDVENIFPDPDADENDPASYDFTLTDEYSKVCCQEGRNLLYRLGSRIEHEIKKYHTKPPKDFAKYARVCEHIILHLCYGWADGLHLSIPYWEIWNEPDCVNADGTTPCWQGTEEQFLEFYQIMAVYLKQKFPKLKIGGPAFTGDHNRRSFQEKFLDYVVKNKIPLDFYSWHGYANEPSRYSNDIQWVSEQMKKRNLCCELIIDEWNYVKGWLNESYIETMETIPSVKGAAFVAASFLTCQKSPLDLFMYYDAQPGDFNGLFEPATYRYRRPFYAFWQFNKLYRLGTEVLSESDDAGIYVGAAKGKEGYAVQLAHYADEPVENETVCLDIKGLSGTCEVTFYVTDGTHENEITRSEILTGDNAKLYVKLNGYSIVLLSFKTVQCNE